MCKDLKSKRKLSAITEAKKRIDDQSLYHNFSS